MTRAISIKAPLLAGLLLTPVAATAGALAAWRFGVEAGWTNTFFIAHGLFSHWQVWGAFAISLQICARSLSRKAASQQAGSPALVKVRVAS